MIAVFFDSDVVVSSLLSQNGAAHYLTQVTSINRILSTHSVLEIERVLKKLNIEEEKFKSLVNEKFAVVRIDDNIHALKEKYKTFVLDPFDSHIIAGADISRVDFLITYNIRHYKIELINRTMKLQVVTPAKFVQYLRSLE